jgi:pyrroline-5-carboxylate reductase
MEAELSGSRRLPILIAGAGAMGGAMVAGWRRSGAIAATDMIVRDPRPGPAGQAAAAAGAVLNPADGALTTARTMVFAVKPQVWRGIAAELAPHLAPDAVIISVVAGVAAADLAIAFPGRAIVRAMPTLASAIGRGSVAVWSGDPDLAGEAAALLAPLGTVTVLADEGLMHAATAASGSAPAYFYAFIEALEAAAVTAGVSPPDAARMVRATLGGAAALLADSDAEPAMLRAQVTSPGGTTEAALKVLMDRDGLSALMERAVAAAVARSRELGG